MKPTVSSLNRRNFLKTSSALAAGAALAQGVALPGYAAESNTLKIALVGCGGRGTGAAKNALSTAGPTQLWAVADVFEQKTEACVRNLTAQLGEKANVPPDRRFVGFDAFKRAIDSLDKGSVVLLATAPAFRPLHFEYAIEKGMHVFMEKSFAVDAPGIRRVLKTGELARQKNLKVAGGLMSRHYPPLEEAIARIHDGAIGTVITSYAYRMHGPVGLAPKTPGMSEVAHQIANYSCFTWLNGSFIVDWLIHNIDVCCWVKDDWPVSVQGMGGRQVRREADQLFDHYMAEYTFADGTRLIAQGRHMTKCYDFFGNTVHGTTGCGVLGEGIPDPRLFKGHKTAGDQLLWRFRGDKGDQYQREHDLLFAAIRQDRPYNETERCAKSCLTAIMGRMACESGALITWDAALNSSLSLAPNLETLTMDGPAPVMPDAQGRYPIAMPGQTIVL